MEQKAGRNDPCTCGSGKKYKKCCGQTQKAKRFFSVIPTGNQSLFAQKFQSISDKNKEQKENPPQKSLNVGMKPASGTLQSPDKNGS